MDARQILLTAADIIGARGWCQGEAQASDGSVCIVRAIGLAAGATSILITPHEEAALQAVRTAIALDGTDDPGDGRSLAAWNDQPGRTQADVTRALRYAAVLLEVPA